MNAVKRNKQGGFTLIELAIVLVIIGLILGAILKGQDLILNARAKKFTNWVKTWEILQLTHLDRKGRYAGDAQIITGVGGGSTDRRGNGIIGDNSDDSTFLAEITNDKGFIDIPADNIVLGNLTFYMHQGFGVVNSKKANVLVVTTLSGALQGLSKDELPYMEMHDAVIDDTANALSGRVRAITGFGTGSTTRVVSGVTLGTSNIDWEAGTHKGLVYFFDRNPDSL